MQEVYREVGSKRVEESRGLGEAGRCEGREAREKRQERKKRQEVRQREQALPDGPL